MDTWKKPRFHSPKAGNLVLLHRHILDQRHGNKLEAHREGAYLVGDLANHTKSRRLYNLNTKELVSVNKSGLKDRVHPNDLKLYLIGPTIELANLVDLLKYGEGDGE